jgi:hypothetical protein
MLYVVVAATAPVTWKKELAVTMISASAVAAANNRPRPCPAKGTLMIRRRTGMSDVS